MLAEDLNVYLELYGGTDASVFLGELSDKLQNMNSKNPNPLLDRIISLVEESRSGHYIDNNSEDFGTQNASAIDGDYHLVKSGQLDETALSKNMEKNFNSQAVQNMIAKFQTTMDSSILDIMIYTDPDANHLMHPALTDILSAYRSETADGHDDIMRKLRKLNSLENKQTSGS